MCDCVCVCVCVCARMFVCNGMCVSVYALMGTVNKVSDLQSGDNTGTVNRL